MNYKGGELIVNFKEAINLTQEEVKKFVDDNSVELIRTYKFFNMILVSVPKGEEDSWVKKLEKDSRVECVEHNFIMKPL